MEQQELFPPVLENDRCRLELLSQLHFQPLLEIAEDQPDLLRYSPSAFGDENRLREYFETAFEARGIGSRFAYAIYDRQQQRWAGSSSFGNIALEHKRLEIGWTWVRKELQGSGLNNAVKELMLKHAFRALGCLRVEFKTDARNNASRRALEKLGAVYEGCLRKHTRLPDGFHRDTVYYSILVEEWDVLRQKALK